MLCLSKFHARPRWGDDVCKVTDCDQLYSISLVILTLNMAKRVKSRKYCVCGGPGLASCTNTYEVEGISLHKFPQDEEQRKKWVNFVRRHRAGFTPSSSSVICSAHFESSCFSTRHQIDIPSELKPKARYLVPGAIPTRDTVVQEETTMTPRERRMVSRLNYLRLMNNFNNTCIQPKRLQYTCMNSLQPCDLRLI